MPRQPQTLRPDPLHIFLIAEQFWITSRLAFRIPQIAPAVPALSEAVGWSLLTSSMANAAFSLELYFKCLIRLGRKSFGRKHDLESLFNLIGKRHKAIIRKYWSQNSDQVRADIQRFYESAGRSPPKINFDHVLSVSRNAFENMRYAHEGIGNDTGWAGDTIVECTRRHILELRPGWERMRQIFPVDTIAVHPRS
jgi:hypothetical protein